MIEIVFGKSCEGGMNSIYFQRRKFRGKEVVSSNILTRGCNHPEILKPNMTVSLNVATIFNKFSIKGESVAVPD